MVEMAKVNDRDGNNDSYAFLNTSNLGNYFLIGPNTLGDCNNEDQDFQKYYSDALLF